MTLYTKDNQYPAKLPNRIRLSNGLTRTKSETFTPEEIADAGYAQVPDRPVPSNPREFKTVWTGTDWEEVPYTESELEVIKQKKIKTIKEIAKSKILSILPEEKQRNLLAQATILSKIKEENWTPEQKIAWAQGEITWGKIAAIRMASNIIENMDPLPDNVGDKSLWPSD